MNIDVICKMSFLMNQKVSNIKAILDFSLKSGIFWCLTMQNPNIIVVRGLNLNGYMEDFLVMSKIGQRNLDITKTLFLPNVTALVYWIECPGMSQKKAIPIPHSKWYSKIFINLAYFNVIQFWIWWSYYCHFTKIPWKFTINFFRRFFQF